MLGIINSCDLNSYKKHLSWQASDKKVNFSILSNFLHFDQLKLDCNKSFSNVTSHLAFFPNRPILIDVSFDLKKILTQEDINSLEVIFVRNIKGVDLDSMAIDRKLRTKIELFVYLSNMDIYLAQTLIELVDCSSIKYNGNKRTFFNYFYGVYFSKVIYPKQWCPYFFMNSKIITISFEDIANSFINKNRLEFYDSNASTPIISSFINLNFLCSMKR